MQHTSAVIGDVIVGWVASNGVVGCLVDRIHGWVPETDEGLRKILSRQNVYTGKKQEQEEGRQGFDVQLQK
jgi:hypothetical protein